MKGLFKIFKRYLPPYYGKVVLNVFFNVLGALFGVFSFVAFSPILETLFGRNKPAPDPGAFDWSNIKSSAVDHINFFFTNIIQQYGEENALLVIGGIVIVGTACKVGFTYAASAVMVPIRNGVVLDIRMEMYRKILKLPIGFFSDERKGDIMARMTGDVTEVENSIMNSLEMFFKNPIIIIVMLTAMISMSWQLTAFVFILLPIVGFFIGRVGKSLKRPSKKGQAKMGEILSMIEETLGGLRIIKAFNAEEKQADRFYEENDVYRKTMNTIMWRRFLAHPMSEFLGTIVIVIILWYGGRLVLSGEGLTPGNFIAYMAMFYTIIAPAKAFSTAFYSIQKGMASMDRIDVILGAVNPIEDGKEEIKEADYNSEIVYKDVTFSYNNKVDVLKKVNMTVPKGQMIALVGQSGSGKSTFVDLLPRLWDATNGTIEIDGRNIKDFSVHSLRELMGNVNQEAILFNDTFYNNISFGVENATKEDVIEAAKVANAHDFIIASENGYDTNIGDRGGKLSGGQRQRLSIARAVLKNPPIMILDEATSALDTESEKLVQEALENLMKNRTTIVIAHRLSTIKNADQICVFHEGEIRERGTHKELLDADGIYKKLHGMQNF